MSARGDVVGVGAAGWDGGTDLFLDVGRRLVHALGGAVDLRWAGACVAGAARCLDRDAELLGLSERIRWVPVPDVVADSRVCVVTARTAPARDWALACSGDHARVVCFSLPDVPDPVGPELVSYPDTAAMASRVRVLLDRTDAR